MTGLGVFCLYAVACLAVGFVLVGERDALIAPSSPEAEKPSESEAPGR